MSKTNDEICILLLRQERLKRRWSQQDVADHVGTTRNNVSRWELGRTTPGPYFRVKLCEIFAKQPQELGLLNNFADGEQLPFHTLLPETLEVSSSFLSRRLPFWHVPYQRNPFFTGRDNLLQFLHGMLQQGKSVSLTQSCSLNGLGGIGKTQTVVEYAYRYCREYMAIFWITADTYDTITSDFVTIANLLDLPEKNHQNHSQIIAAVTRWLNGHKGWLLIFDNIEDIALVKAFLPRTYQGSLLLTSRLQSLRSLAESVKMQEMTRREGAHFLLRRSGLLGSVASLDEIPETDYALAVGISEALGDLPLALDEAGTYISETRCSLRDFLDQFRDRPVRLLNKREGYADHPLSVAKTFAFAFEKIQQKNPISAELLMFCAFLAPDAIPEALFTQGAFHQLEPIAQALITDPWQYNEALKDLLAYSLIQRNPKAEMLHIHRLVQVVLKDALSLQEQEIWIKRVIHVLNWLFPSGHQTGLTLEQWRWCGKLLPHALACFTLSEQRVCTSQEVSSLLMKTASYLRERAHYAEAEPLLQRALAICEQELGPFHPDTAQNLNDLAVLYTYLRRYKEAEPLLLRTLAICEQILGPSHTHTSIGLANLAQLYAELGRYEEVEPLLQRALKIREQTLGPHHPATATSLNTLAHFYERLEKYEEAEPLLQRALEIRKQELGPFHPDTAITLNDLALIYQGRKKYEEAELLLQHALKAREQNFGSDHPITAISLNALACLYQRQEKYTEAEQLYRQALLIREKQLGAEHPDTTETLCDLASLYVVQSEYERAIMLYQHAIALTEQPLGPDHPKTVKIRASYTALLQIVYPQIAQPDLDTS